MSNAQPPKPEEFMQLIDTLLQNTSVMNQLLTQTVQTLTQQGFTFSVDVNQLIHQNDTAFQQLQQLLSHLDHTNKYQELVRIGGLINSSLDLQATLEEVLDTVISLTEAERAYILLKESEDSDELIVRAARNWEQETITPSNITFSRSIIKSAMETGKPTQTINAQDDARFQAQESVMANALRSIVVLPLILREKPMGVLYADNRLYMTTFEQNVAILTAFADQAMIAIDNARLYEAVKADLNRAKYEVKRLQIVIDNNKLQDQVDQITESSYFRELSGIAQRFRKTHEVPSIKLGDDEEDDS